MSDSNDNRTNPQETEKKGLFGWLRRKPKAEDKTPIESVATETSTSPVEEIESSLLENDSAAEPPSIEAFITDTIDTQQTSNDTVDTLETAIEEYVHSVTSLDSASAVDLEPQKQDTSNNKEKTGFFTKLKQGLSKTSASFGEGIASIFLGKKEINDDLLEEIETRLLTSDVGFEATNTIIENLTQKIARKQLSDSEALYKALKDELTSMLLPVEQPLVIDSNHKPYVILVVGVNGAGKTTTIGKLAKKLQLDGKKVMLAAGDTFRAAAVEQLQVWGERNNIPVIAQHTGADSASVIFDAVQSAKSKGIDVLIADTAGRLHNKENLMEELKKVRRVISKIDDTAPHETLLVLDAGTGQNALSQAKLFHQSVELTGLALTKLDGTAKGGVIFALASQMQLPIRFIGVGESIDDLRPFEAEPFVQAIFRE